MPSALGWSGFDVPRWARYRSQDGHISAEKQTMSRTYLPAAMASRCRRSGPGARVRRLLVESGRVTRRRRRASSRPATTSRACRG
ncbi:MAG: hypothetical protein WKF73_13080 [Nocardioidaceae bacterium]